MCGIAGYVSRSATQGPVDRMVRAMAHRGPDDEGVWASPAGRAFLGNRRLSIIDLSSAGHMPMSDPSGQVWITYNGELYNHEALRQELAASGYTFRSHSDTEVVLAAWITWGEHFAERLTGMFAFAIFDERDRSDPHLILGRDRLGIKPLYWMPTDGGVIFASEIKVLLASGVVPPRADRQAVSDYLSLGSVAGPRSIIEGVQALPPGHLLEIHHGRLTQRRYWDLPPAEPSAATMQEAAGALRVLLEDIVREHMVADVPVGAFLSGGIDSTTLVALAASHAGGPLKTFTVRFGSGPAAEDEARHSALMAAHVGADHTEVFVSGEDVAECLPEILSAMDQPSVDGVNSWFVSRATRGAVKVALSGLGSDELFAGYPHFRRFALAARVAPSGNRTIERLADQMPGLPGRIHRGLRFLGADDANRHVQVREVFRPDQQRRLWPDFRGAPAAVGMEISPDPDPTNATSRTEIAGYLVNTLLRDADAMSMAHSLEVRVPFVDHRLVEFSLGLPGDLKSQRGMTKAVLKKAIGDLLPPAILDRPKSYFSAPLHEWAAGPLKPRVSGYLRTPAIHPLISPERVGDVEGAREFQGIRLWALAILGGWLEMHGVDL